MSPPLQSCLLVTVKSKVRETGVHWSQETVLWGGLFAVNQLLVRDTSDWNLVLCSSKDFFSEIPAMDWGDLLNTAVSSLIPPVKLQKLQTFGFCPLLFLSSVPHPHVTLLSFGGYVWHGWWLSGKLLRHYRDGGECLQWLWLWTCTEVLHATSATPTLRCFQGWSFSKQPSSDN